MKYRVDKEKCIGCGVCLSIAPEFFEFDEDGKSSPKKDDGDEKVREAANACPVGAIIIEDE